MTAPADLTSPPPRFARSLDLPAGDDAGLAAAAAAIKAEHRASSEWKTLCCVDVTVIDRDEGLYRVDTGGPLGLDAWEGSTAVRPVEGGPVSANDDDGARTLWSGAVVEADDAAGRLFIAIESGHPPCRGTFYVRPFEFTAMLEQIYNRDGARLAPLLRDRLRAAERGATLDPALPEPWPTGWNLLWGPPGTGKTHLLGTRVAALLADPEERILVVSTTNHATDAAAIAVGRAVGPPGLPPGAVAPIVRLGRGARYASFVDAQMPYLLETDEHQLRTQIEQVRQRLARESVRAQRASLRRQLGELVRQLRGAAAAAVRDPRRRVVITTAFQALGFVADPALVDSRVAPFTTIVVDEAGLLSRATVAALSLLAARRVVLVGDPKQLAPIARMSRVLPSAQGRWLGLSALDALDLDDLGPGRELLSRQYRMHPDIRQAVSEYQYQGRLTDAHTLPAPGDDLPARRAIWYVLDEDRVDLHRLRAERGANHRSWLRVHTRDLLSRLFATHPQLATLRGLFLSPFVGQCQAIADYLRERGLDSWTASTVHQQQGAEADIVVFDTVNAGSHCWPTDEWERLINVATSRAKHLFVLLATRDEMQQPFLAPLASHLWPAAFKYVGRTWTLTETDRIAAREFPTAFADTDPCLGAQIARRRALRPLLSAEQERLCQYEMDGKARLVRGVAGSGKTLVLANWLVRTYLKLRDQRPRLWVVFANASLAGLIEATIMDAWKRHAKGLPYPARDITLHHIDRLLGDLERPDRVPPDWRFEYGKRARRLLNRGKAFTPTCDALFLDEAQDLGSAAIELLTKLVVQTDPAEPRSRAINIFYDNAQNVYGRGTPTWSALGIDVRGRAVIMKESFRSTQPITEFALNVLSRLVDFAGDPDQREYQERGLIELGEREGRPWWRIKFNEIHGPAPQFKKFGDREAELRFLCKQVVDWITIERVAPRDIVIVTMGGGDAFPSTLVTRLNAVLRTHRVTAEYRTSEGYKCDERTLIVTKPHSFKGYEAEVVVVPAVDQFVVKDAPAAAALYVALTRARSLLIATGIDGRGIGQRIVDAMREVSHLAGAAPQVDERDRPSSTAIRDDVRARLGEEHEAWLDALAPRFAFDVDTIVDADGEVIAEPLFIGRAAGMSVAFYPAGAPPLRQERMHLEDAGYQVCLVGDPVPETADADRAAPQEPS